MYHQTFGLHEAPFAITPNPRFVFLGHQHKEALAHLTWGISQGGGGGFVQLTGEVGTGKTTLSRLLLERLPEDCTAALILNPRLNPLELLQAICDELKISTRGAMTSQKKLVDRLNKALLNAHADGRSVVVIIDEAQNLSPESLEQVRLLTNLETDSQKLMQILLLGQPELRSLLSRPDLRQLAQRITARYHLGALSAEDTAAYTRHRLAVAGSQSELFSERALKALHRVSEGIPRVINIVAERALLMAYATDQSQVSPRMIDEAAREIRGFEKERTRPGRVSRGRTAWVSSVLILLIAIAALIIYGPELRKRWTPTEPEDPLVTPIATETTAGKDREVPLVISLSAEQNTQIFRDSQQILAAIETLSIDPDWTADRCDQRLGRNLLCQTGRSTSRRLIELGRPIIAYTPSRPPGYSVARFSTDQVTLHKLGGTTTLPLAAFERHWSGLYWDYWQVPAYVPDLLEEGNRGPAIIWIKQAAVRADPAYSSDSDDPYFGPSLKQWAIDFQNAHGILSDGVIGRDTLQFLRRYSPVAP